MRPRLLFLLALVYSALACAQTANVDSVRVLLNNAKDDRSRLQQLKMMVGCQRSLSNFDSVIYFGEQAVSVAKKLNAKGDLCDLYGNLGLAYTNKGKQPKSLQLYLEALRLADELHDKRRAADNYVRMGTLFDEQNDLSKALKNYYTALSIYRELGQKDRISMVTGNIGNVYFSHKQFEKALSLYLEALAVDKELNNRENLKYSLGYVGMVYSQLAKKDKSKSDSMNRAAINYYKKALAIATEVNDASLVIYWLGNIGVAHSDLGDFPRAEKCLLRALAIADSLGFHEEKIQFEDAISAIYYQHGDYKKSIDHYRTYTREKDSMFTVEKNRELTRHEMNYEFEKKMASVKSEQERKEATAIAQARQQRLIIIAVIIGLVITFMALLVILRALRTTRLQKTVIEKQKKLVDEKQKEIIDSINYARRIQQSVITSETYIQKNLRRLIKK